MLKIREYKEEAKDHKELFEKVLSTFQEQKTTFQNLDIAFTASIEKEKYFRLTSDPLPRESFGLLQDTLYSAALEIYGEIRDAKNTITFKNYLILNYGYNAGSTTTRLAAKGTTSFSVIYNNKTKEVRITSENKLLNNSLDSFHSISQSSEYVQISEELLTSLVPFVSDEKDNISQDEMRTMLPTLKEINEIFIKCLSNRNGRGSFFKDYKEAQEKLAFVIQEFEELTSNTA